MKEKNLNSYCLITLIRIVKVISNNESLISKYTNSTCVLTTLIKLVEEKNDQEMKLEITWVLLNFWLTYGKIQITDSRGIGH